MLIVMKFGGTSVADAARLAAVAQRVILQKEAGAQVVVVVSAQGKTTDLLVEKGAEIDSKADRREQDVLLAGGEQTSMALLAMELK